MTGAWQFESPFYILPDCGLVRGASVTEADDGLYVGSHPPPGTRLGADFGALVLCAREHQTSADYPCVVVLRCPLDDSGPPPTTEEVNRAHGTAFLVARRLRDGHRALVTCAQGVNRSALVAALAIRHLRGCSGAEAMAQVQAKRPGTLTNLHFASLLRDLPALRSVPGDAAHARSHD